jgi:hypothetical protein
MELQAASEVAKELAGQNVDDLVKRLKAAFAVSDECEEIVKGTAED